MANRSRRSVAVAPPGFSKKVVVYLLASGMYGAKHYDDDVATRDLELDGIDSLMDSEFEAAQCPRMELSRMRMGLAEQYPQILDATTIVPAKPSGRPVFVQDCLTAAAREGMVDLVIACRMRRLMSQGVAYLEHRLCHRLREHGVSTVLIPKGLSIVEVRRAIEGHIRSFYGLPSPRGMY
jgi:hypothetical protein